MFEIKCIVVWILILVAVFGLGFTFALRDIWEKVDKIEKQTKAIKGKINKKEK